MGGGEIRFYITSLTLLANLIGPMIRDHWAIENSLHWVMDMIFRDDECRVHTDNAPENFATLKHMANNLIRKASGKDSQRLKRKTAGWGVSLGPDERQDWLPRRQDRDRASSRSWRQR